MRVRVAGTSVPTTWRIDWDAPGDAHWVEYGREAFEQTSSVTSSPEALLKLSAGQWQARAVSEGSAGRRVSQPVVLSVPDPPPDLGRFEVVVHEAEAEVGSLLILLNQYDLDARVSWAALLDGAGMHRWYLPSDPSPWKINRVQLGSDGLPWYSAYHWDRTEDWGTLIQVGWDGERLGVWELPEQHHDFVLDGEAVTWLSWVYRDEPMPGTTEAVATDALRSRALAGGEPVLVWSVFDDLDVDVVPPCSHAVDSNFKPGFIDFSHGNSVVRVGHEYWVMLRYLDQLVAIDGDTGAVRWTLGGPQASVALDGQPVSHPHFSEGWPGGVLVFDNGNHRVDDTSRAVEYALEDGVAREVWSFAHPDGAHVPFLGDVRRLPGGNRLIVWGSRGELMEVTPDGRVVWQAVTDDVVGRVTVLTADGRPAVSP